MNQDTDRRRDDDLVAELMQLAGPRAQPPTDRTERVKANVKAHWQRHVIVERRPLQNKFLWLTGLAAVLVITIGVLRPWSGSDVDVALAPVVSVAGAVFIHRDSGAVMARGGDRLRPGDRVETGDDGLMIFTVASGHELRLDHGTHLTLLDYDRIALDRGAVYVDSHRFDSGESVSVVTPFGIARDIGTRFEVRLAGQTLEVAVRDGEVQLSDPNDATKGRWTASAGEGIRRLAMTQQTETFAVSSWDERWGWTRTLVQFELEGALAIEYLQWLSHEQGWTLSFEDERARSLAQSVAHGDTTGYSALETLEMVLPTVELGYRLDGGRLMVSSVH